MPLGPSFARGRASVDIGSAAAVRAARVGTNSMRSPLRASIDVSSPAATVPAAGVSTSSTYNSQRASADAGSAAITATCSPASHGSTAGGTAAPSLHMAWTCPSLADPTRSIADAPPRAAAVGTANAGAGSGKEGRPTCQGAAGDAGGISCLAWPHASALIPPPQHRTDLSWQTRSPEYTRTATERPSFVMQV